MKNTIALLFITLFLGANAQKSTTDPLQTGFVKLPDNARPLVWWRWYGKQISKEGITKDLEALKNVGLGGVYHFQLKPLVTDPPKTAQSVLPNIEVLSKEWWETMQFAIKECHRLGLEFRLHNSLGWSSSGGPWITPEKSMQQLVWSEKDIVGGKTVKMGLLRPKVDTKWNFYKDVAVIAMKRDAADTSVVARQNVLNISEFMNTEGVLNWEAPAGNWTIFRYGHTTTGKMSVQSPTEIANLECDKMDKEAAKIHFDNYPNKILKEAGDLAGKSLTIIGIDSYEAGIQNWNHKFRTEFQKRKGYDPLLWLPVISGKTIDNQNISDRFKYDFERTISELFMDEYYAPMSDYVHQYPNVKLSIQPYNAPFNLIEMGAKNELPAGEFWHSQREYGWWTLSLAASAAHIQGISEVTAESLTTEPQFGNWNCPPEALKNEVDLAFSKGINSMEIHLMPHQPWDDALKPAMIGGNYGLHINRHNTFWQQSKSWHDYLTRSQFLLRQGRFIGDICYLYPKGQRGFTVPQGYNGDALDEMTIIKHLSVKNGDLVAPSGMRYKVLVLTNTNTMTADFAKKLKELVENGATIIGQKPIQTPSLANYPASEEMVKKIGDELWGKINGSSIQENTFGKGKVILGKSVTEVLTEKGVEKDVDWAANIPDETIVWTHRQTENADIYYIANLKKEAIQLPITFRVAGKVPELWDAEDATIKDVPIWEERNGKTVVGMNFPPLKSYFVVFRRSSQGANSILSFLPPSVNAAFLEENNGKIVLKAFEKGNYSIKTKTKDFKIAVKDLPKPLSLNNDWTVTFSKVQGTPDKIVFPLLISWTEHADKNIRYFSGTAKYSKTITLDKKVLGKEKLVFLDLGEVKNFAELSVNGKTVGLLWKKPFVFDITNFVKSGENQLEIKVTNTWSNRMIGDEQEPDDAEWTSESFTPDKKYYRGKGLTKFPNWFIEGKPRPSQGRYTFSTWNYYRKNDILPASGILGDVKIVFGVEKNVFKP